MMKMNNSESKLKAENEVLRLKLRKLELLKLKQEQLDGEKRLRPWLHLNKFYNWQRDIFDSRNKKILLTAANQLGKLVLERHKVATPSGFKSIHDLAIGDDVIGDNGKPCKIVAFPWEGEQNVYQITFDDETTHIAGENHLWRCKGERQRFTKFSHGKMTKPKDYLQWVVRSTKEMYLGGKYDKETHKPINRFVLPYTEPVEYPHKNLPDPYALGVLLGDGSFVQASVVLTTPEKLMCEYFQKNHNSSARWQENKNCWSARVPNGSELYKAIKEYGLLGTYSDTKFIPSEYLLGSKEERLLLLQGLMDTDGTITTGTIVEFNTASQAMAESVKQLAFSLGGTVKSSIKKAFYTHKGERKAGLDSHRLRIKLAPGMSPFKLAENKLKRWQKFEGEIRYKHERVIRSIVPLRRKEWGRCITVDSPNSCYVVDTNYVVTHNSSIAIIKNIEWATNQKLWPELFPESIKTLSHPRPFWYLYPSLKMATSEFEDKWKTLLPPKDHTELGWHETYRGRDIDTLTFKCGSVIRFKTYMQNAQALQAGTVDMLTADEEVPIDILPELQMRVQATDGYLLFVFTATMGQTFWRKVVEDRTEWLDADVHQVSLYDSQVYEDGSPSKWTNKRIAQAIANCTSDAQVQRRIFGRFVREEGLMFESFNREHNVMEYETLSPEWKYYMGIDYGSGGLTRHPSSISVVAVPTSFDEARVVMLWRGDKINTTCEDVVNKAQSMLACLPEDDVVWVRFDHAAPDIGTIAQRRGLGKFQTADKGREAGIGSLNSLIKTRRLKLCMPSASSIRAGIPDEFMEMGKLMEEFENLGESDNKSWAEDDAIDSLRYAQNGVPFDWEKIGTMKMGLLEPDTKEKSDVDLRRERGYAGDLMDEDLIEQEIEFWNELMED